ncbi:dethiobiotin synthase [Ferviditalea candida]|uniref:ATP-dependent dethiobiotin synthetase BioD n=1 Tax=Ferviditalea candida TaxID=3108399 RepID=A0ABU5ZKR7_9BACL|nr:dethiobiotin synthase [Paenibacillaceae bacterium T2]
MAIKGWFVTGTDTGVGKTQIASGLAALAGNKLGTPVGLWKPVQSGVSPGSPEADSFRLKMGSGLPLDETELVTVSLPEPLAPWMAARRSGVELDFAALVEEGRRRLAKDPFLIVEGAGGITVPITSRELMADLALQLELPLVIVARPGLGTVNHTLLTVSYARSRGLEIFGVILNGCRNTDDPSVRENSMMIEHFGGVRVIGILPWFKHPTDANDRWDDWRTQWVERMERNLDLSDWL